MASFYNTCDSDIKTEADNLIRTMKSSKMKQVLPNEGEEFSNENSFKRLELLLNSKECDEIIKRAYE